MPEKLSRWLRAITTLTCCPTIAALAISAATAQCIAAEATAIAVVQSNPSVGAYQAQVEQAQATLRELRAGRLPRAQAFVRAGYGDGVLESGQTDNQAGISLSYTLFDFGKRDLSTESANATVDARKESLAGLAEQLALEVLSLTNELFRSKALSELHARQLAALARRVEAVGAPAFAGAFTRLDEGRLMSRNALAQLDLTESDGQSAIVEARLRTMLKNPGACFEYTTLAGFLEQNRPRSLAQAVNDGADDNKARELRNAALAARQDAKRSERGWLPDINISALAMQSYDDFRDRFDDNDRVGLEVVFPLFDGGVMRQRSAQADARVRELDFEAAAYRMQREAELAASWRRLDALDLSLLSMDEAMAAAREYVNAARRSFDLRAATLDELLDAEDALTDLEMRQIALEWERREVLIRQLQGRMPGLLTASD